MFLWMFRKIELKTNKSPDEIVELLIKNTDIKDREEFSYLKGADDKLFLGKINIEDNIFYIALNKNLRNRQEMQGRIIYCKNGSKVILTIDSFDRFCMPIFAFVFLYLNMQYFYSLNNIKLFNVFLFIASFVFLIMFNYETKKLVEEFLDVFAEIIDADDYYF